MGVAGSTYAVRVGQPDVDAPPVVVPKHVQVREFVRELIDLLPAGAAAPSERELAARFSVARMTVRQALNALVAEGRLDRIPGRGTFVADPHQADQGQISSFTEEMTRRGKLPESQTLLARIEQARPSVARALGLTEGDPVLHWRRLRRADGEVVCVTDAYLNEVLLPGFLQQGTPTSLYDALATRGLRPTRADDSIAAEGATAEDARLLEISPGAPVLRHSRRALARDQIIEVSRTIYRGDAFTLYRSVGEPEA